MIYDFNSNKCVLGGLIHFLPNPSIHGMQGGQFLRPLSDAVKPIMRQKISKANAYPARVGYSLQTEGRARVKEVCFGSKIGDLPYNQIEVDDRKISIPNTDFGSYDLANYLENEKKISALIKEYESCKDVVLVEKLSSLAGLQTSPRSEDLFRFKIAVQALYILAVSKETQRMNILHFFLEASGIPFEGDERADRFVNLVATRQIAREACKSLVKASNSDQLMNYYRIHLQTSIDGILRDEISENHLKDLLEPVFKSKSTKGFLLELRTNLLHQAKMDWSYNDSFLVPLLILFAYGKRCIEARKPEEVGETFKILTTLLDVEGIPVEKRIAIERTEQALKSLMQGKNKASSSSSSKYM
ncbi:hypothetical protein PCANC_14893 [Puccinia coronata f. sp. avenae]|uniref:Uncharacterized protein n=1 Tax=Puccinia coronata f. sp. avenae TaxID=200324 RepID=A0A2N5UKI6_9BASI|nr:hypothetical protein PCANC_14893 [Puccinia coronata f. sp. avenae]